VSVRTVAILALCMVVAGLIPAMTREPAREITLVAKGMAFYLESDPGTPNPTIEVRAGETVRIVLRNEERGMLHDFAVPAAEASTGLLDWQESRAVTLTVPDRPGTYEYVCAPHSLMMRGSLKVQPN
jgi:plastocyanin